MGFLDRLLGTGGQSSPAVPLERPSFELTVTIGDEAPTFAIPVESTDEGLRFLDSHGPSQTPDQCWVARDREVDVAGRSIGGGLFYLGDGLPAANGDFPILEPALVDPTLEVATQAHGMGPSRFYWPSYERLSPADRATYLEWLASPRQARDISQSLAFLYFYGLERRLLADPRADSAAFSERAMIVAELTRLEGEVEDDEGRVALARKLGELREFLDAQDLLQGRSNPPPPRERSGWQVPLSLRMMVGEVAGAGLPLPAELALSWALTSPEAYRRTPAQRCSEEFAALFQIRYRERFGDGLSLPRGKGLKVGYRPSSPGLKEIEELGSLPDVANSPKLVAPLRELARDCCAELDPYSRLRGRKRVEAESLKGVALLPAPLLKSHAHEDLEQLRELLREASSDDPPWLLSANDLLACWPGNPAKLPKREAVSLAQLVEKLGYGIEPDVRFGGSSPIRDSTVVVFAGGEHDARAASAAYASATMLLDLVAAVAAADGVVTAAEEHHLEAHVESAIGLDPGERERLRAHVEQVTRAKPSFAGLRKRLESLTPEQRERIGRGLVAVAAADGHISPEELKVLGKVFRLLGLDPDSVYSEAHTAAAGAKAPRVLGRDEPKATEQADRSTLDRSLIEARIEETARVSSVLADIFDSEVDDEPAGGVAAPRVEAAGRHGLEGAQVALARDLAEQQSWARAEVEELAAERNLLVDGALEEINNAAFERCDAPFTEGDDPIEVDVEVAKELLS